MPAIHEPVDIQTRRLAEMCLHFNAPLVKTTSKGLVFRASNQTISRRFAFMANDAGWAMEIRKGVHTGNYYLHVFFNQ